MTLKIRRKMLLLTAACLCLTLCPAQAARQLSRAALEQRLDYLVDMRSFKSHRLTQRQLMELALRLGGRGQYPAALKKPANGAVPGCDEFITRSNARGFLRGLTGRDLRLWQQMEGFLPKIKGDKMGWWYNTGNTMYARPRVLVSYTKEATLGNFVQFRIFHRQGNRSTNPPATLVATGTAMLSWERGNWVVTTWQVRRNKNWIGGE